MKKFIIAGLIVPLMSGCFATTKVVEVPVTVPCLGDQVQEPEYKAGLGEYPGDAEAVKMLGADLVLAKDHASKLKARMAGCK